MTEKQNLSEEADGLQKPISHGLNIHTVLGSNQPAQLPSCLLILLLHLSQGSLRKCTSISLGDQKSSAEVFLGVPPSCSPSTTNERCCVHGHGRPFPDVRGSSRVPWCTLYDRHPYFAPQIAGFIFGGNIKQDKIAMTSPVQTEANGQHQNGEESEKIAMTSPVTSEMLQGGK